MVVGIVIVGWLVGAVSVSVALVFRDPGVLGALGLFASTSIMGSLAAGVSLTLRPRPPHMAPCAAPGSLPADRSLGAARAAQDGTSKGVSLPGFSALRRQPSVFQGRR
jgi:hypothetical protein